MVRLLSTHPHLILPWYSIPLMVAGVTACVYLNGNEHGSASHHHQPPPIQHRQQQQLRRTPSSSTPSSSKTEADTAKPRSVCCGGSKNSSRSTSLSSSSFSSRSSMLRQSSAGCGCWPGLTKETQPSPTKQQQYQAAYLQQQQPMAQTAQSSSPVSGPPPPSVTPDIITQVQVAVTAGTACVFEWDQVRVQESPFKAASAQTPAFQHASAEHPTADDLPLPALPAQDNALCVLQQGLRRPYISPVSWWYADGDFCVAERVSCCLNVRLQYRPKCREFSNLSLGPIISAPSHS